MAVSDHAKHEAELMVPGGVLDLWCPRQVAWLARRCEGLGRRKMANALRDVSLRSRQLTEAGYPPPDDCPHLLPVPDSPVTFDPSNEKDLRRFGALVDEYVEAACLAVDETGETPVHECAGMPTISGRLVKALVQLELASRGKGS